MRTWKEGRGGVEVIYRMLLLRSNCVYECHVSHSASEGENLSCSRCLLHRSKGTQCLHLRLGDETCLELQMLLWAITLIKLHFFFFFALSFLFLRRIYQIQNNCCSESFPLCHFLPRAYYILSASSVIYSMPLKLCKKNCLNKLLEESV